MSATLVRLGDRFVPVAVKQEWISLDVHTRRVAELEALVEALDAEIAELRSRLQRLQPA